MLVVMPAYGTDIKSALESSETQLPHEALLVGPPDAEIVQVANRCFSKVHSLEFTIGNKSDWPAAENRCWQKAGWHINEILKTPWFWFKPNGHPITAAWLDGMSALYKERGKPFMGTLSKILSNGQRRPHLSSVAVYPPNAILYSPDASISTHRLFSEVAGKAFLDAAYIVDSLSAVKPPIEDVPPASERRSEANLPLADDTDLPSILEQSQWPVGFYNFVDEGRKKGYLIEYFNPTLAIWRGQKRLITRRRSEMWRPGRNTLMMFDLINNEPRNPQAIQIPPRFIRENWEDPRAITMANGALLLSWCNFNHRSTAHQAYGIMDGVCRVNVKHLAYGRNGIHLLANTGPEKNWTWFQKDNQLFCDYLPCPTHTVLQVSDNAVVAVHKSDSSDAQSKWPWGEIRGGTPPVKVGDLYWTFMHSRLPWRYVGRHQYNRYYMGVLAFDADPPFKIRKVSKRWILAGSEHDPRNLGAPVVVFPCGALLENGVWLVSLGINDCRCAWQRIPHAELVETVVDIQANAI